MKRYVSNRTPSPPRRAPNRSYSLRIPNPDRTREKRERIAEYRRKEALIVQLIEEMVRPEVPPKKLSPEEVEFYNLLNQILDKDAKEGFELTFYNNENKVDGNDILRSFSEDNDDEFEDDVDNSVIVSQEPLHQPNTLYSRHLEEMLEYKEMGKKFLNEFNLVYLYENVYLSRGPIKNFEPEDCVCVRRCDENCINKLTKTECVGCHIGENCGNDKFQRRRWKSTTIEKAGLKGHGLFPNEDIRKGSFVIEYVGEILDGEQLRDRKEKYQRHCYFFSLGNDLAIDASLKGNQARFINHSCDPNCEPQKWLVDGEYRIGFFAKKDIPKGTELSFDYSFETFTEYKQQCLCGSANCRGFITSKKEKNQKDIKILEAVSPTEQLQEVELDSDEEEDNNDQESFSKNLNVTQKMRIRTPKRGRRRRKKKKKKKKKKAKYDLGEIMKNQEQICQTLVTRIDEISKRYDETLKNRREGQEVVEKQQQQQQLESGVIGKGSGGQYSVMDHPRNMMMMVMGDEKRRKSLESKVRNRELVVDDEDRDDDRNNNNNNEVDYGSDSVGIFDPSRVNRRFILKRNLKRGLMKRFLQIYKKRQEISKLVPINPPKDESNMILPPPPPSSSSTTTTTTTTGYPSFPTLPPGPPGPPGPSQSTSTTTTTTTSPEFVDDEPMADVSSDSDEEEERRKGKMSPRELRKLERDQVRSEIEEEDKKKMEMKKRKMMMKKMKMMKKMNKMKGKRMVNKMKKKKVKNEKHDEDGNNVTGKKRKRSSMEENMNNNNNNSSNNNNHHNHNSDGGVESQQQNLTLLDMMQKEDEEKKTDDLGGEGQVKKKRKF